MRASAMFLACVVVVATGTFSQTEPTVVLLTRATDAQDRCVLNAGFISVQCRDDTVRSSPLHPQQPWQVSKQPLRLVRFQLCFRSQLAFRTRTRAQPLWNSCKARHVVRSRIRERITKRRESHKPTAASVVRAAKAVLRDTFRFVCVHRRRRRRWGRQPHPRRPDRPRGGRPRRVLGQFGCRSHTGIRLPSR